MLRHPHKIRIGDNVVIDDNCLLDAKGEANAGITIGSGVFVGRNTILSCKNGDIELADGANIGFNCEIFSASRVTSRAQARSIAAYVYLIGGDHEFARPRSSRCSSSGAASAGISDRRRGVAGRWRQDARRRHDRRSRRCRRRRRRARAVPPGATAVGIPARLIGEPRER